MNAETSPGRFSLLRTLAVTITLIALVALAIGLGLAVKHAQAAAQSRRITLPGGIRVEYLGVTTGNATFTLTNQPWQRLAKRLLPPKYQYLIPREFSGGSCSSGSNSITLFFSVTQPAPGAPIPWSGYAAEDTNGFRFRQMGGYCSFGGPVGTTQIIYGLGLPAFPRRQPDFLFHFLNAGGAVLGTFRVPNPVHGPFPIWTTSPLPQTITNLPVTLTLKSLTPRTTQYGHSINPGWQLTASDPSWAAARVRYFSYLDATGNEGGLLSTNEPAWKLRALVFRDRPVDFSATEKMTLTNLSVPAAVQFTSLDQSADLNGVSVKVLVLAGAGTLNISNGVTRTMTPGGAGHGSSSSSDGKTGWTNENWGNSTPFFLIELQNTQPNDEIEFHLHDDQGRQVKISANGYSGGPSGGGRTYQPTFTPPDDAKSLDLEVIVNRPLKFEFMINPADVQSVPP